MTSRLKYTAILVLALALTGCRFWGAKPKAAPDVPVPEPAQPIVAAPPPKVEQPGPPPKIESKTPEVPTAVSSLPKPPPPKPARRRPAKRQPPKEQQAVAPPPVVETPQPAPAPKLGEILTDEQRTQYLKVCDESLSRAKEALVQLRGAKLSADQKQSLTRIDTFIKQAEDSRTKDPQTARQLAERADVLSRDLVRTLR